MATADIPDIHRLKTAPLKRPLVHRAGKRLNGPLLECSRASWRTEKLVRRTLLGAANGVTTAPEGGMMTSWRWILLASFAWGVAQPAVSQSISPLPERVARLPDTDFSAWFSTMLGSEFREGADWQDFFGDVGPTEGCDALRDIENQILARDLASFKAAYVDAVSKGVAPTVF
jgi:hypothetical protein